MKKITFLLVILSCSFISVAQKPYWLDELPSTKKKDYYYRITRAEGETYEKAYSRAFAMCILESSWKLGVAVDTKSDLESIENYVTENINVRANQMNISINKACVYSEPLTTRMGVRIFVLWQVAKPGNANPKFEEFTKCKK